MLKLISGLILLLSQLITSGQKTLNTDITTQVISSKTIQIPINLLASFIDSIRMTIYADTVKFNKQDLKYTISGRRNIKPYSNIYTINDKYTFKLDIIDGNKVIDFVNKFIDSNNIKSIKVLESSEALLTIGQNSWNKIIFITLYPEVKFNSMIAGLTVYEKKYGDNFTKQLKGEILAEE